MKELFEHKIVVIVVSLTVIFLVFMAFRTGDGARANWGTDGVNIILKPFQTVFTNVSSGVGGFFAHFKDLEEEQKKNIDLEARLVQAENDARELESYKSENERLRGILNLQDSMRNRNGVAAEVIARDVVDWYSGFTINKGSNDGIAAKQAVITNKGLVGYVSEVGLNWAKVTTIINNGTSAGGIVVRTQDVAIVEGDFQLQREGLCKMTYISKGANIVTGDSIETSGLGGIYPKGLLIGIIRDISSETQTVSQSAVIEPAVDFEKVTEVLVIK